MFPGFYAGVTGAPAELVVRRAPGLNKDLSADMFH